MKTLVKWAGRAAAAVVFLLLLTVGYVWLRSATLLQQAYPKPAVGRVKLDGGPDQLARGAILVRTRGCNDCHGRDLTGSLFHDEPQVARLWAPNLTRVAAQWSAEDIDRALRHGVRRDGRGLWVMPSSAFANLTDADAAAIIAYLRSRPATGPVRPRMQVGPVGRLGVVLGKFESEPALMSRPLAKDLGPATAAGRYLALTACAECHGRDLKGGLATGAPDLLIAASYDPVEFRALMRTGIGADGKSHGLMTAVARARFAHLSEAEISALHVYLGARAEATP